MSDTPAAALADGLAAHIERWVRERGGDARSARRLGVAARTLSLATADGHVCITLDELGPPEAPDDAAGGDAAHDAIAEHACEHLRDGGPNGSREESPAAASWRRTLLASGVVGTPEAPGAMPLVLDADGRLYLHRHFDHERRLAERVMRAAAAPATPVDAPTQALLNALFRPDAAAADAGAAPAAEPPADWQKIAAALALRRRLTVISGGPGTGKTTTVVNLLACLLAQAPDCRIALAAPTGKAAARLTDAIRQRAAHLPPAWRERLPSESYTVHRLLGVTATPGRFVHHAGHPLAIDALVVDEASMLDLALATRLLDAVPESARIVLLGDKDQLAAVEAGAVFSELCADPTLSAACRADLAALCETPAAQLVTPPPAQASALRDSVVWFTRNFRFAADSSIGRLAADINAGRAPAALDTLREAATGLDAGSSAATPTTAPRTPALPLRWLADADAAPGAATAAALREGYARYLEVLRRDPTDHAAVLRAFDTFRVLCAVRAGPRGTLAINERLARWLRETGAARSPAGADPRSPWFTGRPVMVLRNDPVQRLFNGDIGIALPDAGGALRVVFPAPGGGLRALAPARLPPHETAFAITVHKSQGSEFDAVLVLLPARRSRVVTRELLYTAVTRARHALTLSGSAAVIADAVARPSRRRSGLLARLRDTGVTGPTRLLM